VEETTKTWFDLFTDRTIVRRGLKFALVVGFVLIAINHGDAILSGEVGTTRVAKMVLTVMVPYFVSVFSSITAVRHKD